MEVYAGNLRTLLSMNMLADSYEKEREEERRISFPATATRRRERLRVNEVESLSVYSLPNSVALLAISTPHLSGP
jgi:hypothetical protein